MLYIQALLGLSRVSLLMAVEANDTAFGRVQFTIDLA
jgi:hypothetical protein